MSTPLNQVQLSFDPVVTGLNNPVHVTNAGDRRLFVVEQSGRIRIVENGQLLSTPFLDISSRISSGGEQGLLSVAFPPGYASKGHFYVNYTDTNGDTVIARYRLSANANQADPGSEEIVLKIPQPFDNHNGGQLAFGPDGYLYIGMGDGGSGGDPQNNAQNPASLLGKMLRIDVESGSRTYTIPRSNPFLAATDPQDQFRDEIWSLGWRNPWRFSFDRQTGDLFMADVGQNAVEEVNFQSASSTGGENYGWRLFEGNQPYSANPGDSTAGFTFPVATYTHDQGRSVTGGFVFRGNPSSTLQGIYLYGDFINGRIWGLRRTGTTWENTLLTDTAYGISTFGEDQAGSLYVADYFTGTIYRISAPLQVNTITGTRGSDRLVGTAGDDAILGLGGNDTLMGLAGSDQLSGGTGQDQLSGSGGNDVLLGNAGSDGLRGNVGRDVFALQTGTGRDQIFDFRNGVDRLGLTNGLTFESLTISRSGSGSGVVIRTGSDVLAILDRTTVSQIDVQDFVTL
jgi:glucose/arabinose dehydrogenase